MKCPKCGYERKQTDIAPDFECPKCGVIYSKAEKTVGDQKKWQKAGINENNIKEQKTGSYKAIGISFTVAIILAISSFVYFNNKREQERIRQEQIKQEQFKQEEIRKKRIKQEFIDNVIEINRSMTGAVLKCMEIIEKYSSVWKNAIKNRSDFNDALKKQKELFVKFGNIQKITELYKNIGLKLQALGEKKDLFPSVHSKLVELYGVYTQLHTLAKFPSGSLLTFNKKANDLQDKYIQIINELKVLLPIKI